MAFPVPGDTNVRGRVLWFNANVRCGQVEAYAADWQTPDYIEYFYSDPLRFPFVSQTVFSAGQDVTFDVLMGNYSPYAANVAAA